MHYFKHITRVVIATLSLIIVNVASAANVVVFNNFTYVEQTETNNIIAALNAQGHTVSTFSGITAVDIVNATAGQSSLIIPEFNSGVSVFTDDPLARAAIFNFTNAGGNLLVTGADVNQAVNLLNSTFGFSLIRGTSDIAGLPLVGAVPLTALLGTYPITATSVPLGATNLYTNGADAAAFTSNIGAGNVSFLGYNGFSGFPNLWSDG